MDKIDALMDILLQFIEDIRGLKSRVLLLNSARNEAIKQIESIPEVLTVDDIKNILRGRLSTNLTCIEEMIERVKKKLDEKERDFTEFIEEYNLDFIYDRKLKIKNRTYIIKKVGGKTTVDEEVDGDV